MNVINFLRMFNLKEQKDDEGNIIFYIGAEREELAYFVLLNPHFSNCDIEENLDGSYTIYTNINRI